MNQIDTEIRENMPSRRSATRDYLLRVLCLVGAAIVLGLTIL